VNLLARAVATSILAEEAKGVGSQWASYIALLPRTLNTPLHWTPGQLSKLHYPAVVLGAQEQREHFRDLVASAQQRLAPGAASGALDRLEWAMEMALSRALDSAPLPPQDPGVFSKFASAVGLPLPSTTVSLSRLLPETARRVREELMAPTASRRAGRRERVRERGRCSHLWAGRRQPRPRRWCPWSTLSTTIRARSRASVTIRAPTVSP